MKKLKEQVAWACPKCKLLRTNRVTHTHGVSLTEEQFKITVETYRTQELRKKAHENYEKLRGGKHERKRREGFRRLNPKRSN